MPRTPVTIALPVWNSWETTRGCLDALRQTMGIRDQVIVVDNGSSDATTSAPARYPWIEYIRHEENRGFGAACNAALARARHEIVVFLHNDTIPLGRWIEPLVEALSDAAVAAAGPVSNNAPGSQWATGAGYGDGGDMRRFARAWAHAHRHEQIGTERLNSFCLAARRTAVQEIGGFDEGYHSGGYDDDDLCQRLVQSGHTLVIRPGSFVHHAGQVTFAANGTDWFDEKEKCRHRFARLHGADAVTAHPAPLLSACIITKDERERLPDCLRSLEGVVDQVVIYDTGSTDDTVQIGRSNGATVIEGFWDDDFSRARNAALQHCQGEWIAWLDADETLCCDDHSELRRFLAGTPLDQDGWSVRIENLTGAGVGSQSIHHASRFFRRRRCEWAGRLHEQVARRGDHGPIRQYEMGGVAHLRHTGYLDAMLRSRDKAERNLRVAEAEIEQNDGWDRSYSLTSLARSLLLSGRIDEALSRIEEALSLGGNSITRRLAVSTAIDASVATGRLDEALEWCARFADEGAEPSAIDRVEVPVRLARGEFDRALVLLDRLEPDVTDSDGFATTTGSLAAQRAQALAGLGRFSEAADTLLCCLSEEGILDTHLGAVVEYLRESGRDLRDLAAAIPADRTHLFLAQVLQLQPEFADSVLEACLAGNVDQKTVLATASSLGLRLPVDRALMWSARLRAAGYGSACPLIRLAESDAAPADRARAAATAHAAFGDARAASLFSRALSDSSAQDRTIILAEASQLCPDLCAASESSLSSAR
ncbi:MAG TPA: glycosyltransferase [Acidimicrobiales bacterium]|nr:glycosyltransferase [Acidimicrobiales bacterium]